jgi:hypothetical protein
MTVDTTKFYRGSKSMHFVATTANAGPTAFIVETKTFTGTTKTTNNDFWGRYFILSGVAAAADFPQGHAVYGVLGGPTTLAGAVGMFHFVGGSRGILQAEITNSSDAYTDSMVAPNAPAQDALGISPAFPLASDGWQCWEWHLEDTDSYDFYLNGVAVPAMQIVNGTAAKSGNNFAPLPTVTSLSIGWQYFGAAGPNSGWIDEVAIGPHQIGCGN